MFQSNYIQRCFSQDEYHLRYLQRFLDEIDIKDEIDVKNIFVYPISR